jgi:putative ABC transport system permease protein
MGTPLAGGTPGMSLERLEDYEPPPATDGGRSGPPWADFNSISADYFRTLSIPLVQGREFTSADTESSQKVALVDEAFAQTYWPGKTDVVGKHLFRHNHNGEPTPIMVVGVVKSTRNRRLTETPRRMMYFPMTQFPSKNLTLTTRTGIDSAATIRMLREVAKDLDPNVPVFRIRTLEQQKSESLALERMAAMMLSGFGLLALLLAALGIYGVLAYSVSRRTREIGVRMALGAQITDVLRMVLRQGIGMVTVGLVLGVAGALAATRALQGFLYETETIDPLTFIAVIVLLMGVAFFACWLPARRAARVNPMEALRTE